MVYERMKAFINDINSQYEGKTIAIVSHGHPLWAAEKVLKDFDYDNRPECKKVYPKHDGYAQHYVMRKNNIELDLHRPFIDDITWKE